METGLRESPAAGGSAGRKILHGAITAIVDGTQAGARHGIRVDDDGLLACGEPAIQLTWMDARVDAECITPRTGKPVEMRVAMVVAYVAGVEFNDVLSG